ncbi:MAG: hypothetical protein IPL23_13570 [Saprospiraceae bacterium]|nr:hypothetical protein [Saprospiraceae bacterium]
MKYWNIFILPIFLLCELRSQSPNFDVKTIVIPLQNVAGFYEDQRNNITIDSILNKGNIQFEKIDNLNLGIINHASWLKFNISNSGSIEKGIYWYLIVPSMIPYQFTKLVRIIIFKNYFWENQYLRVTKHLNMRHQLLK